MRTILITVQATILTLLAVYGAQGGGGENVTCPASKPVSETHCSL